MRMRNFNTHAHAHKAPPLHLHFRLDTSTATLHLHFRLDASTATFHLHFRFDTSTATLRLHCKKKSGGKMGCACARRARHASHRDNFKSRDKMDALDWPLARMRSLHLYFWWGNDSPTKTRCEMSLTYYWRQMSTDFHDFDINGKKRPYPLSWYQTIILWARQFQVHKGVVTTPLGRPCYKKGLVGRVLMVHVKSRWKDRNYSPSVFIYEYIASLLICLINLRLFS